jgi:hypothetical protein
MTARPEQRQEAPQGAPAGFWSCRVYGWPRHSNKHVGSLPRAHKLCDEPIGTSQLIGGC